VKAAPSDSELIAIAVALGRLKAAARTADPPRASAWSSAMRLPDLEIEDLRALVRSGNAAKCSTRF
jgi:hypothetical protein